MGQAICIVDAFTDRPFAGNPAAVCVLNDARDSRWMQSLAAEMNLSETAFLYRVPRMQDWSLNDWVLRWFTPRMEVDLCGHATLASAHVLWNELGAADAVLNFRTRSGLLSARRSKARVTLDFPADPPVRCVPPPGLTVALGREPAWTGKARLGWVAVFDEAREVRDLVPDFERLARLEGMVVMVTAPGDDTGYDFISRVFAPRTGISEDPVTGAAHCCFAVLWGERLGQRCLRGYQASARGGAVEAERRGSRVLLSGSARTISAGVLRI